MNSTEGTVRADGGEADPSTVLVVDDEAVFAESAGKWLEPHYDVRVATDAESAIEQYDASVDVVLIDRRMPVKSGDEVIAEISAMGDPMIAVVSAVEPDVDLLDLEFDRYLHKPVTRDDVLEAVATLVGRRAYPVEIRDLLATRDTLDVLRAAAPTYELADDERFLTARDEFERHLDAADLTRQDLDRLDEAARQRG